MKASNKFLPIQRKLNIFLADDDEADCLLFKEALEELPVTVKLTTVQDGEQLMELLAKKVKRLPDALFLDLNMPRKNGMASLGEIKRNSQLEKLPVIIFSTASEKAKVSQVYKDAAHYYIRKPAEFSELKKVIYNALALVAQENPLLPGKENFMLTGDLKSKANESSAATKKSTRKPH
jgi:CheY-like chemotaxis protein